MKDVDKKIKDLEQLLLSIVNDKDINCWRNDKIIQSLKIGLGGLKDIKNEIYIKKLVEEYIKKENDE